jgi:plasmid stabilization system protein ParE
MKEYRIVFAPTAQEDLGSVVAWLDERAPEKVAEWIMSLKADIDTLQSMPERCPYAAENGLWGDEELRQLLFQPYPSQYRVIFTIHKSTVRILNVRHSARRYLHEQ